MTDLPDAVIKRGARLLFDKANPDIPSNTESTKRRDKWFNDTLDYWMRATQELAEMLGTPAAARCRCGAEAVGPVEVVKELLINHRFCSMEYRKENGYRS